MSYLSKKPGSIEEVAAKMSKYATESEYQQMFKKELEKAGKGIGAMTDKEKKDFFNKIDSKYSAKNEQAKNPYAIGMAAAMKAKDDKPPLKKSTITKAHDIAKSIEKDMKKETHSFVTNKQNQKQKDAKGEKEIVTTNEADNYPTSDINKKKHAAYNDPKKGEKEIVDPKPKLNFKEMYGKISASKKKMKEDEQNQNKKVTDTGEKPTEIDLKPKIHYNR